EPRDSPSRRDPGRRRRAEPVRRFRRQAPAPPRLQPRSVTELPRQAHVSWWMEEARAAFAPEPCSPLLETTTADVVILGGGYTGMWTAWFLKERDPSCDVVLLEADEICGAGPSGRNGGFCYGMWEDLPALVRFFGDAAALRIAETAQRSVDAIEGFLTHHGI